MFLHGSPSLPNAPLALGPLAYAPAAKKVEITGAASMALVTPPPRSWRRESPRPDVGIETAFGAVATELPAFAAGSDTCASAVMRSCASKSGTPPELVPAS